MEWYLNDCLELKAEYPELVVGMWTTIPQSSDRLTNFIEIGFDMAGQEDPGHPLIYFAESLLKFRAEAEKRGLDIPFMFHAVSSARVR